MSSQIILCISQSQKWSLLNSVSARGFLKSWLCPWALNHQDFAWSLTCNRSPMYVYWIDEWINGLQRFISGLNFLVSKAKKKYIYIYWLHSSHRHIKQSIIFTVFFSLVLSSWKHMMKHDIKIVSFEKCFQYLISYLCPGLWKNYFGRAWQLEANSSTWRTWVFISLLADYLLEHHFPRWQGLHETAYFMPLDFIFIIGTI